MSYDIAIGKTRVIDIDIRSYFDTIRHDILLSKIAKRVQDDNVMRLLKLILKSSGKIGVLQGGPLSPLISNIYLNEVDIMLEKAKEVTATNGYSNLEYTRWADDVVILVDGFRKHRWIQGAVIKRFKEELTKLKLELNEEKTKVINLEKEKLSLTFLGFRFRKVKDRNTGRSWTMRTPTVEARSKLQQKIREIFRRNRARPVKEVVQEINPVLRGWVNYFRIGHSSQCFCYIKDWTEKKVRRHMRKAQQKSGFGWNRWSKQAIYRRTELFNDYQIRYIT